jgi:hypothetical protein
MDEKHLHADYRCDKETDCTAEKAFLQNLLPMWRQESDIRHPVQKVPRKPDAAQEQNAGCKEVIVTARVGIASFSVRRSFIELPSSKNDI